MRQLSHKTKTLTTVRSL